MKKNFFSALCSFIIFSSYGQNTNALDMLNRTNLDLIRSNRYENKYDKATGSAYINDNFFPATISGVQNLVKVRYNAEADEFQIENDDDSDKNYTLPKKSEYSTIEFKNGFYKFELVNYKDVKGIEVNGYLIEKMNKNHIILYKREKVNYFKAKEAENSYTMGSSAKLVRAKDEFYLQLKNKQIVEFPKNKKKFIALFGDKKDAITAYLKDNDVSFSDESDIAKIAEFISTL